MAEKILYVLGAGASAKNFPLARSVRDDNDDLMIKGLPDALDTFAFEFLLQNQECRDYWGFLTSMKEDFQQLATSARNFGDVDTYAKYLHLMKPGGEELKSLKGVLSKYFSIKQLILNDKDSRYLPWLVGIMNKKTFPSNVKILSWNYDFQVELAGAEIGDLESINHSGTSFTYSQSFINHYPNLDPTFSAFPELHIYHLNGVAGFNDVQSMVKESVFESRNRVKPSAVLELLKKSQNLHSSIFFAWERNDPRSIADQVQSLLIGTTIVVVIGYSFPFFNREVDKSIFEILKGSGSLRKIYYQDPVLNGQQLKERFGFESYFPIVHISQVDNFHIPFEY